MLEKVSKAPTGGGILHGIYIIHVLLGSSKKFRPELPGLFPDSWLQFDFYSSCFLVNGVKRDQTGPNGAKESQTGPNRAK